MTDKEILIKAVKKANLVIYLDENFIEKEMVFSYQEIAKTIIFNHDFCKAFWGEESFSYITCPDCDGNGWTGSPYTRVWDCKECNSTGTIKTGKSDSEGWQYYLQQMVLETEPLKYLEKFL